MNLEIEQCPEGGEGIVLEIRLEDFELTKEMKQMAWEETCRIADEQSCI